MHFQHLDFPTACMSTDICCPGEIRRVAEALKMLQAFVAEKTRCWLASIRAVVFGEFRVLVLEAVVKGPGLVVFISRHLKLRSFYSFNQFTQFTNFTQFTRFTPFCPEVQERSFVFSFKPLGKTKHRCQSITSSD